MVSYVSVLGKLQALHRSPQPGPCFSKVFQWDFGSQIGSNLGQIMVRSCNPIIHLIWIKPALWVFRNFELNLIKKKTGLSWSHQKGGSIWSRIWIKSGSNVSRFGNPMFCYPGSSDPFYFHARNIGLDHCDPNTTFQDNQLNPPFRWDQDNTVFLDQIDPKPSLKFRSVWSRSNLRSDYMIWS